jgi:hypothetical protein
MLSFIPNLSLRKNLFFIFIIVGQSSLTPSIASLILPFRRLHLPGGRKKGLTIFSLSV